MRTRTLRALRITGLALAFAAASPANFHLAIATASAQTATQDSDSLIRELRDRIDRAARTHAADPRFLEDLRQILSRYESAWPVTALSDDFSDNDYARNPAWTVRRGAWMIDRQYGLKRIPGAATLPQGDASLSDRAISSGAGWSGPASNAFDDDTNTAWTSTQSGSAVVGQAYIGQNFGSGNAKSIQRISIRQSLGYANSYASEIEVQRWTGTSWTGVGLAKLPGKESRMVIELGDPPASEQWRLVARKMEGNGPWQVAEIEMLTGAPAWGDGTGIPAPQQAAPQQNTSTSGQKIEDLAVQVLGEVLRNAAGQQRNDTTTTESVPTPPNQNPGPFPPNILQRAAEISIPAKIANSFAVEAKVYALAEGGGQFGIGLYRADTRNSGYRLTLLPGPQSRLELAALSRGYRVIDSASGLTGPSSTQPQTLRWERKADGTMTVAIDGRVLFSATDRTFKDGFTGVVLISDGADVALRSIKVETVK